MGGPLWSPRGGSPGDFGLSMHGELAHHPRATIKALPATLTTLAPTGVDELFLKVMPIAGTLASPWVLYIADLYTARNAHARRNACIILYT